MESYRNMGGKKKEAKEKPLEKMTAKELREVAKEIPDISGVHGMNKPELISAVRKARGIEETDKNRADTSFVRDIKKKIRETKAKREAAAKAADEKMSAILRRRIIRLKKKTRRAAA